MNLVRRIVNYLKVMHQYSKYLWSNPLIRDWDQLLELEQISLNRLLDDFKKCKYFDLSNEIKYIEISIRLLDIILDKNGVNNDLIISRINLNNRSRFDEFYGDQVLKLYERFMSDNEWRSAHNYKALDIINTALSDYRTIKAYNLYCKIREYKLFNWTY